MPHCLSTKYYYVYKTGENSKIFIDGIINRDCGVAVAFRENGVFRMHRTGKYVKAVSQRMARQKRRAAMNGKYMGKVCTKFKLI